MIGRSSRWLTVAIVVGVLVGGCSGPAVPDGKGKEKALDGPDRTLQDGRGQTLRRTASKETAAEISPIRFSRSRDLSGEDDPRTDGWDSEILHNQADLQLNALARLMSRPREIGPALVEPLAAADFSCGRLRPARTKEVFSDRSIRVSRPLADDQGPGGQRAERGAKRLAAALGDLLMPLATADKIRVKFKQYQINISADSFTTTTYYEAGGQTKEEHVQQNGRCTFRWLSEGDDPPRLLEMRLDDYEEVVVLSPRRTLFSDCTEAVLGHNACFAEQLMFGREHWLRRRQQALGLDQFGHHGLAVGDVNGDGLEDLYVCQGAGLPNRLFVQNPEGTATDIAASAGVDYMERTQSALLVDLDNDGDQDLVLATAASLVFLANDGRGRFRRVNAGNFPGAYSLAAADYDQDGDLDIYACYYGADRPFEEDGVLGSQPIPYHDANNGAPNRLFRNEGRFVDVTGQVGLDVNNERWSFAASWEDYDNDGDVDLYVANDYGRNNLYRNDGGRFVDVAEGAGVEDTAAGMSVSWADVNRDGRMDVYIGNMFSAAGGRIAFQRKFHSAAEAVTRAQIQRHARGNTLFVNRGGGVFEDVSLDAAVTMGRWAWGSVFVDVNNDGWQDLVVANGNITNHNPKDL
jgi:hypothetical protein